MLARPGGARLHDFWQQASKRRKFGQYDTLEDNLSKLLPGARDHAWTRTKMIVLSPKPT